MLSSVFNNGAALLLAEVETIEYEGMHVGHNWKSVGAVEDHLHSSRTKWPLRDFYVFLGLIPTIFRIDAAKLAVIQRRESYINCFARFGPACCRRDIFRFVTLLVIAQAEGIQFSKYPSPDLA